MATKKVSALTAATTLVPADLFYVCDTSGSVSKKCTFSNLIAQLAFQPANATLTILSGLLTDHVGPALLVLADPSVASYIKIGTDGSASFKTAAELRTDIDAQQQTTNLDLLSALTVTAFGGSVLTDAGSLVAGYVKNLGDQDQTLQYTTPTALADELRVFLAGPRVTTIASSATPTPNAATTDVYQITDLATAITTFNNPSGSAAKGQRLLVRIKDDGTARALSWGTKYKALTPALPTTTVTNRKHLVEFVYNADADVWDTLAVSETTP